jgi:hypothetical protein
VGDDHRVDVGRRQPDGAEVGEEAAPFGLHCLRSPGFEQDAPPTRLDL